MIESYYKDIYNMLSKKYPGRKIYIISDEHFYHKNIITYSRPLFKDVLSMNEYIINKHNQIVNKDDIVIFLGDFSFKYSSICELNRQLNGHKYLLLGNHDSDKIIKNYDILGFDGVFKEPVKINDMYLSHEPLIKNERNDIHFNILLKEFNRGTGINYHGHIHNMTEFGERFKNTVVECNEYSPILIGYTDYWNINNKDDFMNSKYFIESIDSLCNGNSSLIIKDYIYTLILEELSKYIDDVFICGSFTMYKRDNFISNFSDLDIGIINDDCLSHKKNISRIKTIADSVYSKLLSFDNLNLSFYKKYTNMNIFNIIFSDGRKYFESTYYDSNLVPLNIYIDSDFSYNAGISTLQKTLYKYNFEYMDDYSFPKYRVKFLNRDATFANLILQYLFQNNNNKKIEILKKIKYLYGKNNIEIDSLDDIISRFLIRNILFFHMTKRYDEIDYIKFKYHDIFNLLKIFPNILKDEVLEIFNNKDSLFNQVFKIMDELSYEDIPSESKRLIKFIKTS